MIDAWHIARQGLYLMLGQYGSCFIAMFAGIYLTRLVQPADVGNIAAALFCFSLTNWLVEFGWDQAFMAHQEFPLHEAAGTHLWIRFFSGFIVIIILGSMHLLHLATISPIWWILAGAHLSERVGLTYKLVLERSYRLGSCSMIEFIALVVSYLIALIVALNGYGGIGLALQRLIEKAGGLIGYIIASPWKGGGTINLTIVRTYLKNFGLATWIAALIGLVTYDFMAFLVDRLINAHQAGLYAKAFSLGTFPLIATAIASRLTSPLYARYQGNIPLLRRVFVTAQAIKMCVLIPAQAALVLMAPWWIIHILGPQWSGLVVPYIIMAAYGLARAFFDDVPNVMNYGFKDPWALTKAQMVQAGIILICAAPFIWWWNATGAAMVMALAMVVATIVLWLFALRRLIGTANAPYTIWCEVSDIVQIPLTWIMQQRRNRVQR